jgi:putative SOS response-associated peptidase YedK
VPVVRYAAAGGLEAVMMHWGLLLRWVRKITEGGILSCTLVATATTPALAHLDSGMPVILNPADFEAWLSTDNGPDKVARLLTPWPDTDLECYRVSDRVNRPKNDPRVVEPLAVAV